LINSSICLAQPSTDAFVEDNEPVTLTLYIDLPGIAISIINNSPWILEIQELLYQAFIELRWLF